MKRLTIGTQVLRRVILFSLALTFVSSVILFGLEYRFIRRRIESEIEDVKALQTPAIASALWTYDLAGLESLVRGICNYQYISFATVIEGGVTVVSYGRSQAKGRIQSIVLEASHKGRLLRIGELELHIDEQRVAADEARYVLGSLCSNIILLVIESLFVVFIFRSMVIDHIVMMARHFELFEAGVANERLSLKKKRSSDELDSLADSFNALAGRIGETIEELRASERRYRRFFEDSPISIWEEDFSELKLLVDSEARAGRRDWAAFFEPRSRVAECAALVRLVDVNPSTLELLGYDDKAALLRGLSKIIPENGLDALREEFMAFASGLKSYVGDTVHLNAAGEPVFVHFKASIVPGSEESWSRVLVSIIDISARLRTELALRESESKYRSLVEQSIEGIILVDGTGTIIDANRAAARMVERVPGEGRRPVVGRNVSEFEYSTLPSASRSGCDYERIRAKWECAVAGGATSSGAIVHETEVEQERGDRRIIEQSLFPISTETGRLVGVILKDVTEQRALTGALRSSLREKELLLQELHHRVKNNLQVICSLISLQRDEIPADSAREPLADLESRIRSISLVHELLYQADNFAQIDLRSYITQLIGYAADIHSLDRKRIKFEISIEEGLMLPLDKAVPCGQLTNELIVNSIKHAFPGDRHGTIAISAARAMRDSISLEVRDDGVGGAFPSQADGNRATAGHGIVRNLVMQLGGNFESSTGQGTRFAVVFPV